VFELIQEEGNPALKLRVYDGRRLFGFQYGFTFDETVQPDDTVVSKMVNHSASDEDGETGTGSATVQLLVDPLSLNTLLAPKLTIKKT